MSRLTQFIKNRPVLSTMIAGVVVVAGVGAASAQYYGNHGGWGRGGHGGQRGGARIERFCKAEINRFQPVMRAYLKADLNLNAGQSAEFDKLADNMAASVVAMQTEVCGSFGPNAAKITPPERLEKLAITLRKAADSAQNAVAPAKSFYATLDDAQKQKIDQRMERRRGMMGDGERRGWRERGEGRGERGWRRDDRGMGGPGNQGGYGQSPSGPGGPFYQGGGNKQ